MPIDRITVFCFAASYAVALAAEVLHLLRPLRVERWVRTCFAAAGLLAHTLYLAVQQPALSSQFGSLLFLAWILAVFYFFGSLHHRRSAWGLFTLPLVLGLVLLAAAFGKPEASDEGYRFAWGRCTAACFWQRSASVSALPALVPCPGAVEVEDRSP